MLINFRPQARSTTGICAAWPPAQLPLIYFFFSDFVASAWGVEGLPVWVVTTKGGITVDIPRPRHLPVPTHENHWNPPEMERDRVGSEEEARVSWWGCQATVSSLMDGRPARLRALGIQSHPSEMVWSPGSISWLLERRGVGCLAYWGV